MRSIRVGVDLGGTKILGVALDPESPEPGVLTALRASTPVGGGGIVDAIVDVATRLGSEAGHPLASVGVGAAGLVDEHGMLRFGPNLPGVVDLDLIASIGSKVGVPVAVDNDATCAAVAEHQLGAARGADTAVVVSLGTGIGGGVIMDGQIRRGAHHMAGEFGHMPVDPGGPVCGCGNRGCWEQYASGSALGRLARAAVEAGKAPSLLDRAEGRLEMIGGFLVASAAADGDPAGRRVLDEFAHWVAVGLAGLVNALDPDVVVIGGGLVREGDLLLDPVREHLAPLVMGASHRPSVPVVAATTGDSAAAIGAALLVESSP